MERKRDPVEMDRRDPLARFRDRFDLPEGLIYLGGHSLGPPPRTLRARAEGLIGREWGTDLVAAWNRSDWLELPERVGARIAPLVGAGADEVIAADSVSLNLFKLLGALMLKARGRSVVLADEGNFPTDLYMAQGLARLLEGSGATLRLTASEDFESGLGSDVAVATVSHVDFRTGRKRDLRALTAAARGSGVPLVCDLSHSAGAVALRLNEDEVEYAVGCGYKYLNGGPGAPGFLYVARERQGALDSPLTGWMGHASPFDFDTHYRPAPGMRRFLTELLPSCRWQPSRTACGPSRTSRWPSCEARARRWATSSSGWPPNVSRSSASSRRVPSTPTNEAPRFPCAIRRLTRWSRRSTPGAWSATSGARI